MTNARLQRLAAPVGLGVVTLIGTILVISLGDRGDAGAGTGRYGGGKSAGAGAFAGGKIAPAPVRYGGGKSQAAPLRFRGGKLPRRARLPARARPAWVDRQLGPRRPAASLVRVISRDYIVTLTAFGYRIAYRDARFARAARRIGPVGLLQRFRNGVVRATAFGEDVTTVQEGATSVYVVVLRRQGRRTWTWRVDTNLSPTLRDDGSILLEGRSSLLIQTARAYNARGQAIGPPVEWTLEPEGSGWTIGITVDDRRFPLPYVIAA